MTHTTVARCGACVALMAGWLVVLLLQDQIGAIEAGTHSSERGRTPVLRNTFSKSEDANQQKRLREGTVISDRAGVFRQDGDGAFFITDDGWELGGLPNLNLERVVRVLKSADESKEMRWSVSGTVTEFSGRNYLLITRAIYKSAASPPPPEQVLN